MTYRYEQVTARSEFQFNQVEGLAIGYNITLSDLKGTMTAFARRFFGADKRTRFRCSDRTGIPWKADSALHGPESHSRRICSEI